MLNILNRKIAKNKTKHVLVENELKNLKAFDKEIIKFKAKDSEIVASSLCLGNISKDWSVDNMKNTGLNGYVYDFSVDYDATAVDDIKDIHKYLMKKNNIVL